MISLDKLFFLRLIFLFALYDINLAFSQKHSKPNIIILYADDLGYGDLSCYGATEIATPNIDKLAQNGVRFTDAHSSSATCTPSRYSLLTGGHAFRKKVKILKGDAPLLIDTNKGTIPKMLKSVGYTTAVVGKWHLGLGNGNIDWNKPVFPGPSEIGFDYSFILPATGDRVPTVYLDNQTVVGLLPKDSLRVNYNKKTGRLPTGKEYPEKLKVLADAQHSGTIVNGVSRIGYMAGGKNAWWKDEDFPLVFTKKSKEFISKNTDNPFFLMLSFHDIHVPRLVNEQFKGKSKMGSRGDAILQLDWCVGEIMDVLQNSGLIDNTLIIFTSDNGPVLFDGYHDGAVENVDTHRPAGPFRGSKNSVYEGGTRVPTITYWPLKIKPSINNALWSQVDLYKSLAGIIGADLQSGDAYDGKDVSDVILGKNNRGNKIIIEEGHTLAIRYKNWKYIRPSEKAPMFLEHKNIDTGVARHDQLYNLKRDVGESKNIADRYPRKCKRLKTILDSFSNNSSKDIDSAF